MRDFLSRNSEKNRGLLNERIASIKHGKSATGAIRLGASLQAALHGQNNDDHDVIRMLSRVTNVVEREMAVLGPSGADARDKVVGYIQSEIEDFLKAHTSEEAKNRVQLKKIAKMQKLACVAALKEPPSHLRDGRLQS